jgi:hypothetical protein
MAVIGSNATTASAIRIFISSSRFGQTIAGRLRLPSLPLRYFYDLKYFYGPFSASF